MPNTDEPPSCDALRPRAGSHSVLVLPDAHFSHVDPKALGAVLLAQEAIKPRDVVILGDWLDCESWSAHPKKSLMEDRAKSFKKNEIDPVNRCLDFFEQDSQRIVFIEGNHENRVERKLCELGSFGQSVADLVSPKALLSEGRRSLTYIDYTPEITQPLPHHAIASDLIALHGWSFAKQAAQKHLDLSRCYSLIYGHTHRVQVATTRNPITGVIYRASSPGCLSRLQPIYLQHNPSEWSHGFDLCWVSNDKKSWTIYTVTIRDGVCVLPGGLKIDGSSNRGRKLVSEVLNG